MSPALRKPSGLRLGALMLAAALGACAAPQGGAGDAHLPDILNDARHHPENRAANVAACERSLGNAGNDFPYAALFAGMLDVPQASGNRAFCAALVEAVIAGDFSQSDQNAFKLPAEIRGRQPVGTLLRALMVANERLYAQQAQQPPQAQSCGCGQ